MRLVLIILLAPGQPLSSPHRLPVGGAVTRASVGTASARCPVELGLCSAPA